MSLLRPFRLPALVLVVALAASACGREAVAASLGDDSITRSELLSIVETDPEAPLAGGYDRESVANTLEAWLLFEAVNDEIERRGDRVTPEDEAGARETVAARFPDVDLDSALGRSLVRQQAVFAAAQRLVAAELPEPTAEVVPPAYLCSSHILVATEDEARAVLDRLDAGEDFAAVARDVSLDPGSADAGGDLGCHPEGTFVPEFEAAAYLADNGDVVGPVQSSFGWHVIWVRSVGPGTAEAHPDIDQATADQILADARDRELQSERDRLLLILRDEAVAAATDHIEVDRRYGVWNPETHNIDPTALPSAPDPAAP